MTTLISRHNPFNRGTGVSSDGYRAVSSFSVEDDDEYGARGGDVRERGSPEEGESLVSGGGIEKLTFMLKRGEYGIGFGFVAAKESIVEMRLAGWGNTHLMDLLSFAKDGGLYVAQINDDSPAKEAGMLRFDVIQKVNGQDVRTCTANEIVALIKTTEDVVVLEVLRNQDSAINEAQVQWDHVKDPLHKMRTGILNLLKINPNVE